MLTDQFAKNLDDILKHNILKLKYYILNKYIGF